MSESNRPADFFPGQGGAPDGCVVINGSCLLKTAGPSRVVVVSGMPIVQYAVGDRMAEAHAMVTLVQLGRADQTEVARAFGVSTRTVRRFLERQEGGGLAALGRTGGFPKGRKRLPASRGRRLDALKAKGLSNRAIAAQLGVTENAIREQLASRGWKTTEPSQSRLAFDAPPAQPNLSASAADAQGSSSAEIVGGAQANLSAFPATPSENPSKTRPADADPNLSGFSETPAPLVPSFDTDPGNRWADRLMARLGMLDDAEPMFRSGTAVQGAGALLSVPAIVASGVLDCAREVYGGIGPAFYGLRTTMVALVLMALMRIKRAEGLKERPPDGFGRILGLDRAPEVKTMRRKLARLAALARAARFGRALAERRVREVGSALAFLYVDGHVRAYHGKRRIPKAHLARMRIAMPATTDYYANDSRGEPLLVITAEANAGLVKMLPPILKAIREVVGERRVTVVFDRGGWSPELFRRLIAAGFEFLTYRKGPFRRLPRKSFVECSGSIDGRVMTYKLADKGVHLLRGKLRLRQVTRLSDNGHQTPIVTTRRDLPVLEIAFRMFDRWGQENFFKYMREEFALDALVDYAVEPDNPDREVPNPVWAAADADLRKARAALDALPAEYGLRALLNEEARRKTMRGFKIAHGQLARKIAAAARACMALEAKRAAIPKRVPVQQIAPEQVIKLAVEKKHLTNVLKMVAFQAESELVRLVTPHFKRAEQEGRTLIQSALASAADIEVAGTELRVTLAPLSSAHRSRAIAAMCRLLNAQAAMFPGTKLRLRFEVKGF